MIKIKKLIKLKEYLKDTELCEYDILFNNQSGIIANIDFNDNNYDFRMLEDNFLQKVYDLEFSLNDNYSVTNTNKNPTKLFNTISYLIKLFVEKNNPEGIYFSSDNDHLKLYIYIVNKIKNDIGFNFEKTMIDEKTYFIFYKTIENHNDILNYLQKNTSSDYEWDDEDDY